MTLLKSPFDGPFLENIDSSQHLITTDHPYMAQLGLSVFTTGQLSEWLNKKDKNGDYSNAKIFMDVDKDEPFPSGELAKKIFGFPDPTDLSFTNSQFNFSAWRPKDFGGEYTRYENTLKSNSTWEYQGSKKTYKFKDLNFIEFDDKKAYLNLEVPIIQPSLTSGLHFDKLISNLITMNDWVRFTRMSSPMSSWNDLQKARYNFITDIKSSFEKCIEWSGIVPFRLNLNTKTIGSNVIENGCIKNEWVVYRLYLHDEDNLKKESRSITLKEPIFVNNKVDAVQRTYASKINGEIATISSNVPEYEKVAGKLDLQWNEFEGKWMAGTPQILAMIVSNIKAANTLDLKSIQDLAITDILDPAIQHESVIGSAIPLMMQNGNPFQTAPDYKNTKDCRGDNVDKHMIRVYNRVPRSWASGDIVVLNKIDGIWQPTSYGEPRGEIQQRVTPSVDGQWDFMYLMTTAEHFFVNSAIVGGYPEQKRISYQQFELGIREFYYENDPNNQTNPSAKTFAAVTNDYFQVTSWDFMGSNIGGLRENNALACTQYYFKPDGKAFNEDENWPFIAGKNTTPFFGCVFPEGYNSPEKYASLKSTPKNLFPRDNFDEFVATDFMTYVLEKTNLFENKNANNFDGNAGGMFVLDDFMLKHLPADIATNCSPFDGNWGSPIKDIHQYKNITTGYQDIDTNEFKKIIENSFFAYSGGANKSEEKPHRKGMWLGYGDDKNPVFNLQPTSPGYISFRPLKTEVYASYEYKEYGPTQGDVNDPRNGVRFWQTVGAVPAVGKQYRGQFAANCWKNMIDKKPPMSLKALDRSIARNNEPRNNKIFGLLNNFYNINYASVATTGLRYNIDIPVQAPFFRGSEVLFPKPLWTLGWNHGRGIDEGRPAGAFGIIGAQCTITANDSIKIDCDSIIGMENYFVGNFTGWVASYKGYPQESYDSHQSMGLHMRVFHAWPRNLTIYDPRFFSVFHFNPGVLIGEHSTYPLVERDWYSDGTKQDSNPNTGNAISYPFGWYKVDREITDVDTRIPTSSTVDQYGISQPWDVGAIIYSSNTRKFKDSNLAYDRRGKLLPYTYNSKTIGFGISAGSFKAFKKIDPMPVSAGIDIIIDCPGSGFSRTTANLFTTIGGKGSGILLLANIENSQTDESGNIFYNSVSNFTVLNSGTGFYPEDFLAENDLISGDGNGLKGNSPYKIRLVPIALPDRPVVGKGFIGGIVRGRVIETKLVDEKPKEIITNYMLNEPPDVQPDSDENIPAAASLITHELPINEPNLSDRFGMKNKYDVFLHFHNDISHTLSETVRGSKFAIVPPDPCEQHITINIVPN